MATTQSSVPYVFPANYIEALKARDAAIAAHFFSYFRPRLRRLLHKIGAPPDEIEDLLQETFTRVLAAIQSTTAIRHPEKFGGFVAAVCTNALLEQFRRRKRYVELEESVDTLLDEAPDQHAGLVA